ncbi:1-phosphatidylinositol phosphodiesterase-like [Bombina bombina]|uniref:1-phosphatidylinositol phosphodiesterase-like n=1 Tax=Bombina bombina TaxID=8345 RepID=UPI00235AA2F3|nr:1-phosphatidylinositol phosphodiesterase-like [Bombina bombina]
MPALASEATYVISPKVAEALGDQTPAFDRTENPLLSWPNWMALLPDNLPLASIAMPGTHDTMSFYGGPLAECQSWSLKGQLQAGVRFLDIRCRHYEDRLPIFHGVSYQRTDFTKVLNDIITFLVENPTETVLMRLKEEYEPYMNTRSFYTSVAEVVNQVGEKWFLRTGSLTTLGEARGKIVILQQFSTNNEGPTFGPPYPGSMSISDAYQVSNDGDKLIEVERHLIVAQNGDPKRMYITYTSGTHWLLYNPESLARIINPKVLEFLIANKSHVDRKRTVGVVIMDFPGSELVNQIILDNWQ